MSAADECEDRVPGQELDADLVAFVDAELARLVGALALYVGNKATAEELAQDALVRLCQHWPRVRQMTDRRAWLNKVAFNLAKSWFRRRYAERRANTRHGPPPETLEDADAAVTIAVRRAVADLPGRQKTALVLRYYAELSVADTAELMSCRPGTVKSLTHRAIGNLRSAGLIYEQEANRA